MAFSSSSSFSGIPWQQPNPQFGSNFIKDNSGVYSPPTAQGAQIPANIPNKAAQGLQGQEQSLLKLLQGGGPAQGALSAASQTQQGVSGLASKLANLGGNLAGAFSGNLGYANKALSDAFDPQQAAYKYYLQQQADQVGSQEAASGLANTPYGAEVTGASTAAFNNAWQTQQIGREATGAATATGLQSQYEQGVLGGGQLIDEAGNLNIGSLQGILQAYGLQGSQLQTASQLLQSMMSDLKVGVSSESGGGGGTSSFMKSI